MRRTKAPEPMNRDGIWYLWRRVPKAYAHLDKRLIVRLSTNIAVVDDPRKVRARQVVQQLNQELEAYWRGLADGQSAGAHIRFEAARQRASALGLVYQTAAELTSGARIEDVLQRVELLLERGKLDDEGEVAAVLGGEARPQFKVSDLPDEFEKLNAAGLSKFSAKQRTRWKAPKSRAASNFIEAMGGTDKHIDTITRRDALLFREWWQKRLAIDGLAIGTANKDIGHMNKMMRTISNAHHLDLEDVFSRLRMEGETTGSRDAFTLEQATQIVLSPELDRLNDEARDIVLIVAETGLRPSEVCSVLPHNIHLEAPIPYFDVLPEDRVLKNEQSVRQVVLIGNALAAFKRHPKGFPRYLDNADTLSATVNKALRKANLLPTKKHTLYSFRHAFEDRLTDIEAPEKVMAALMGHKYHRPKYGKGPSLELKRRWLEQIVLPLRPHVEPPEGSD